MSKKPQRTVMALALLACTLAGWSASRAGTRLSAAKLPEAVRTAVRKAFPGAKIDEINRERRIIQYFEVAIEIDGRERDVLVADDGTILALEHEIEVRALPESVRTTVARIAGRARLEEAEQRQVLAAYRPQRLAEPKIEFEVKLRERGRVRELIVGDDGQVRQVPTRLRIATGE